MARGICSTRSWRARFGLAVALVLGVAPTSMAVGAMPATAQEISCVDGSRESAQAIAGISEVTEPIGSVSWTPPSLLNEEGLRTSDDGLYWGGNEAVIALRYSDRYQCAWALVEGAPGVTAWVDRSEDGGRSWDGELGKREVRPGNETTYTAAYRTFDGEQIYDIRACGYGTITEFEPRARGAKFEDEDGPVICTEWFPVDWTIVDSFTSPEGGELPLRLGRSDFASVYGGGGFGLRHIEERPLDRIPDRDLIQQTLDACEVGESAPGTTVTCSFAGVRVAYSERVDYENGGQLVGIVTAFIE